MNKFIDYFSPEKDIIKEKFNTIPYMDVWISSIIEGYIYENVSRIVKIHTINGCKEEYTERYGKKEGEYKKWWNKKQIWTKSSYKRGELEGAHTIWFYEGQMAIQQYYKGGVIEGEYKVWYENGQISIQEYYKEGKKEGEGKWWDYEGVLTLHKIYKDGKVIEDLLKA